MSLKNNIKQLDIKVIIINLYLTQFIIFIVALFLFFIFKDLTPIELFFLILPDNLTKSFISGSLFSGIVVIIVLMLNKIFPEEWLDDGGLNKRIFSSISIWHIGLISTIVGFNEEILFRGFFQPFFGVIITSILFSAIHTRYLKKIVLLLSTFLISVGLGILVNYSDWFSAFIAHAQIDFILGVLIKKGVVDR